MDKGCCDQHAGTKMLAVKDDLALAMAAPGLARDKRKAACYHERRQRQRILQLLGGGGIYPPNVLRASIKNSAKTWRGVSYAPFFPPPHWGFESSFSRFVNSARRSSYGIEDKDASVNEQRS